jgi:hypothetical protein
MIILQLRRSSSLDAAVQLDKKLSEEEELETCPNCRLKDDEADAMWLRCGSQACLQWWHTECDAVDDEYWQAQQDMQYDYVAAEQAESDVERDSWLCPYCDEGSYL